MNAMRLAILAALISSVITLALITDTQAAPLADVTVSTGDDELSQPMKQTRIVEKVKIPMRDGVRLVADTIFPEPEDKYPTILIRTPYGRRVETDWIKRGLFFANRGYVVVVQAVRGREDSEGEWQPWMNERKDGYDTIDWISRQSWSDGNVGMIGGSYLGEVQLQAAAESHPALKCIIPYVSGSDHFFGVPYDHGIFNLEMIDWLYLTSDKDRTVNARPLPNQELLQTLPLSRLDDAYLGNNSPIFEDWLKKDRPSNFAAANFLDDLARSKKQIPILHLTGWWDGAAGGVMRNWRVLNQNGYGQQWLVIGFWEHNYAQ
ncbi:MAG: CocE/NonD family hydrolase, partial [Acidobacteria bacterium]|nr:CocE/NonD family hydrolase [Acidobacteriota bacterium]